MYMSVRNIKFAYVSTFRIQFVNWSERVVYMWVMIYCFSLLYHCQHLSRIQLYIWATRWFLIWSSYCFAPTWVFDRVSVAHLFRFLRCVFCFVLFVLVLCVMYPMWPVSLYFPFRIAPSVFSNGCFLREKLSLCYLPIQYSVSNERSLSVLSC